MNFIDVIVIVVLVIIFSLIILYIKKQKSKGIKCIGCPFAKTCSSNESCKKK